METFPSKVDPEILPEDQSHQIDPEDTPVSVQVSFTQDEIAFLKKLLSEQRNSSIWITEVNRLRLLLQSIAHQVKTYFRYIPPEKSILDPDFDLISLIDEIVTEMDLEDPEDPEPDPDPEPEQKQRRVKSEYTMESPFI